MRVLITAPNCPWARVWSPSSTQDIHPPTFNIMRDQGTPYTWVLRAAAHCSVPPPAAKWRRSAPVQRRAPRVFCSGALRACLWALHAAVAVPFINRALENWGGLNWEDRFHHNDRSHAQRGGIGASLQRGVVMTRKKAETQRLPDACYDVRPASKQRGHN